MTKAYRTETQKLVEMMQHASERRDTQGMITTADEVLRREPNNVDAMFVAGTAFMLSSHEGIAHMLLNAARCATKDPVKLGSIWNNLGFALQKYQPDEAYRCFKECLKYGDAPAGTYDNLCATASEVGRHAEALDWADKAVGWPVHHNRAFALLHLGRWEEAWKEYARSAGNEETRPRTGRNYDLPRWDGKKKGKVIIHGEQGVGDEIMFMSMLPSDWEGVIECSPRMEAVLQRSFPNTKVYGTLLNNYIEWPLKERADYHIEMGGLGELFAAQPFSRGRWMESDISRKNGWRSWLSSEQSRLAKAGLCAPLKEVPLVGLAWTGGTWTTGRGARTIPFELIAQLIEAHPDVTFVNLEYEDRKEELADYPQVLNPYWATKKGADMDDLVALVDSLDMVISATNSTVDVAGALGKPTWALVPHNPPWRYSDVAGEDRMWFYESVRTFRQRVDDDGSWQRVINQVSIALKQQTKAPALQLVAAQ